MSSDIDISKGKNSECQIKMSKEEKHNLDVAQSIYDSNQLRNKKPKSKRIGEFLNRILLPYIDRMTVEKITHDNIYREVGLLKDEDEGD